ncbi:U-box domain-containing protein 11-like [Cannabis sativa]|uniref:U-box domain-containing protein 11-like n=1 Tax=Cannabis sativa TaxID=3483 RepID=UPI0029CA5C24|nr:U-box domain-containing protein 11-like [Cannabis sativa]
MSSTVYDKIVKCVSEAQSDNYDAQERALQALASITKVSPQNRNLVAQSELGAIQALLNLIKSSSSSTIQVLSLAILFNLSLNPGLKRSLASMETISHLNSIIASLETISQELGKLASSLVCSLAMNDKNKAKFGVAGTVELLIEAISLGSNHDQHGIGMSLMAKHHLLSSLAELVQFHGNSTLAVRSGVVQTLMDVVESDEGEELSGTCVAVLCLVAKFDEGLNEIKTTQWIVSRMVNVVKGRCMMSKEGATEILIRLFDESEECVRDAMRLPEFLTILADLSVRGSTKAREKASLLMKKMTEVDLDFGLDSYHPM